MGILQILTMIEKIGAILRHITDTVPQASAIGHVVASLKDDVDKMRAAADAGGTAGPSETA